MINIENIGASSHDKIIISQTFGRETGFICGSLRYWDKNREVAMMLLLPEDNTDFSKILRTAKKIFKEKGKIDDFLCLKVLKLEILNQQKDKSGQIMYGSSGNTNCQLLNNKFIKGHSVKNIQPQYFTKGI